MEGRSEIREFLKGGAPSIGKLIEEGTPREHPLSKKILN